MKKLLLCIQNFFLSKQTVSVDFTSSVIDIHSNASEYLEQEDLIFFPHINVYGAFKYEVVKNILTNIDAIGVSDIHLALNNIYFSTDQSYHKNNKKVAINHLDFLSKNLQFSPNDYTAFLFKNLKQNFPKNQSFDLVDYLVNPIIFINVLKEYGFLEVFPHFDPNSKDFSHVEVLNQIKLYFSDTDQLELLLKKHLDDGGEIPLKMKQILDELKTDVDITSNLPKYFRSMIFSAVESTCSFLSFLIYTTFIKYPHLLTKESDKDELYLVANEVLRIFTPVPFIYRTVREDLSYGSISLKKGDLILLFLGAANMDSTVFENPSEIYLNRKEKHLSFGKGQYACIGQYASFRVAMNVLSYLSKDVDNIQFLDKNAKQYIHNSMLKLPLKIIYVDSDE